MPRQVRRTDGSKVRIIGGKWRRRRLETPAGSAVRPTPDRVRETLFNWLAPTLAGARCLDLFAGTGVLGLEAASRGASQVVMVDRDPAIAARLRQTCELLGADIVEVVNSEALAWLANNRWHFDVVFLDPPYGSGLLDRACEKLVAVQALRPGARIYLESRQELTAEQLPCGWRIDKAGKAGQVRYHLASF